MTSTPPSTGNSGDTQELNPAERNQPPSEVPTPESQTEGAQRMPPKESEENTPNTPASDRA